MNIAFRVDASLKIGTGHLMRCLTLADALSAAGHHCHFITREHLGNLNGLILQKGHSLSVLSHSQDPAPYIEASPAHAGWLGSTWQDDAAQTKRQLAGKLIDWLIVDHYALDRRWEQKIAGHCQRLMVIDDLADRDHHCHLLLDQSLGRRAKDYRPRIPPFSEVLLGPQFALLRPEFAQLRERSLAHRNLPRVRTDIREYMTTSNVMLQTFQLNKTARLDQDLYGMVYGGYLESMYAGVGGEVLYRPMNEDWALGANLDLVRQREFDQHFGLRDYQVATGFVTLYWQTGFQDILATASAGRYLARDWGGTLDLSRQFRNGVRFGTWVTLTTANKEAYGEGSFDKGIYVSIPFDELMSSSTMRRANLTWNPLTRDGGARLGHYYSLYDLTDSRDQVMFQNLFGRIVK